MPAWGGGNDTPLCVPSLKDWTSQDAQQSQTKPCLTRFSVMKIFFKQGVGSRDL